jgi:hypothetical protein
MSDPGLEWPDVTYLLKAYQLAAMRCHLLRFPLLVLFTEDSCISHIMPPKKKTKRPAAAAGAKATAPPAMATHVFVLTLKSWSHSGDVEEPSIVGVFASKEDAVASIPSLETQIGPGTTLADYIDGEGEEGSVTIDKRRNPPDTGVILKVEYSGEGDFDKVRIKKVPYVATGGRLPSPPIDLCDSVDYNDDDDDDHGYGLAF